MQNIAQQNASLLLALNGFVLNCQQQEQGFYEQANHIRERLTNPRVSISFGGRFSSGKSTLLNGACRQKLLPTNAYADTGVICVLRQDIRNNATLVYEHGKQEIPCTTEAIAKHISLRLDKDGQQNSRVMEIKHLEIGLKILPSHLVHNGLTRLASMIHLKWWSVLLKPLTWETCCSGFCVVTSRWMKMSRLFFAST